MVYRWVLLLTLIVLAGPAAAADAPLYGPAPTWISPIKLPPTPLDDNRQPARILLIDNQVNLGPDSSETYSEFVGRAQTTEGLQALGNVSRTWDPQTDVMIINKLRILRGDTVIDVLAPKANGEPGKTFTVLRREDNLELSMLDGRLTASLQIEDLRVGDIVDFAYTMRHHDPSFNAREGVVFDLPADGRADRLHIRVLWPDGLPIHWRKTEGLDEPKVTHGGAQTELLIDMAKVKLPKPPEHAPPRFAQINHLEVSGYGSWADVSGRVAPLFVKAEALAPDSPLRAEVARIRALSADKRVRASEALKLVEDKVRYVFLGEDLGGYKPAAADLTWSRRFGDCKGKTVLLVALLRELGLEATPVVVSTTHGDGLDAWLPTHMAFNHAIVRLKLDGRIYWLDATRSGDLNIDRLVPPSYRWALPVVAGGAALAPIEQPPLAAPTMTGSLRLDASQGLTAPAPAHVEIMWRGDQAPSVDRLIRSASASDLDTYQRNFWRQTYPWITIKHVSAAYDPATGEARMVMDGVAQLDWRVDDSGRGKRLQLTLAGLGRPADFKRDPGARMDAPYATPFPEYIAGEETVILPDGGRGYRLEGRDIDRVVGGVHYSRTTFIKDGAAVARTSTQALAPEFPANAAYTTQLGLADLAEEGVWVRAPVAYNLSKQELSGASALEPTTTEDYYKRALELARKWETDRALADVSEVLRREPAMSPALLVRAQLYLRKGQLNKALADLDAAIAAQPDNLAALYARSQARLEANHPDLALADADAAVRLAPNLVGPYYNRGGLYLRLREPDKALADYNTGLEINPEGYAGLLGRARAQAALGRSDLAKVALGAIGESANSLNSRCYDRAIADLTLDAALAECEVAVSLAPTAPNILDSRGFARFRLGDFKGAAADFDAALALDPKLPSTLFGRGLAKLRLGDRSGGQADIAAAKALDAEVARTFADYGLTP
jgi:tetratricopeptide (TPR) repeat protein